MENNIWTIKDKNRHYKRLCDDCIQLIHEAKTVGDIYSIIKPMVELEKKIDDDSIRKYIIDVIVAGRISYSFNTISEIKPTDTARVIYLLDIFSRDFSLPNPDDYLDTKKKKKR